MANPLNNLFPQSQPASTQSIPASGIQSFKRIAHMMQDAGNPQAALSAFAQKNPRMAEIMQLCSGKNPKDIFYSECKRRGLNPDEIVSQLGIK